MITEYGFPSLNNNLNPNRQNNNRDDLLLKNVIQSVRVKSIVLDETHPRFKEVGEWSGLGAIEYSTLELSNDENNINPISYPLNPNSKNYPLINEIVYIINLPNQKIGEINNSKNSYYINTVSIWNHPHHNGYPLDKSGFGKTFKERSNLHPLLPFEGDVIQEGRWGNSIRFGSTVKDKNNWSKIGEDGDPIIIIRNGQGKQSEEGWLPITENINNDESSIYLGSTQQIPIKDNPIPYDSYNKNTPISPSKYSSKQIILNSGRLVFNSNEDHILINSQKSINFNSIEGINFDTNGDIITNSKKLLLGSKDANEPLLLGNKTEKLLNSLIINLKSFMNICSTLVSTPPGTPLAPLNIVASEMQTILGKLQVDLKKIKSKDNYTI